MADLAPVHHAAAGGLCCNQSGHGPAIRFVLGGDSQLHGRCALCLPEYRQQIVPWPESVPMPDEVALWEWRKRHIG